MDAHIKIESELRRVSEAVEALDALHLVVYAAGALHGPGIAPEKSIQQANAATFEQVFALNTFAPLLLAKVLLHKLCRNQPAPCANVT